MERGTRKPLHACYVKAAFCVCYTGTRAKGLSFQYSRTKPPFGLISIRVTFLLGKSKRSRPQRNEYRVIDLDPARLRAIRLAPEEYSLPANRDDSLLAAFGASLFFQG